MNASRLLPFLLIFSLVGTCIEVDNSVPGFPQIAQFFDVSSGVVQKTITWIIATGIVMSFLLTLPQIRSRKQSPQPA